MLSRHSSRQDFLDDIEQTAGLMTWQQRPRKYLFSFCAGASMRGPANALCSASLSFTLGWSRADRRRDSMHTVRFVHWQEREAWIGYLQDYPDYWTQGESLDDLKEHLRDLYADLTGGELPGIRKVDDLIVA